MISGLIVIGPIFKSELYYDIKNDFCCRLFLFYSVYYI